MKLDCTQRVLVTKADMRLSELARAEVGSRGLNKETLISLELTSHDIGKAFIELAEQDGLTKFN